MCGEVLWRRYACGFVLAALWTRVVEFARSSVRLVVLVVVDKVSMTLRKVLWVSWMSALVVVRLARRR